MHEPNDVKAVGETVKLVDPEVPADQGLASLGLLMQLAGSVLAAYATMLSLAMLLAPGTRDARGYLLLVVGACVARSLVHRAAGTELLYPKADLEGAARPFAGIDRYVLVGLAQSVIVPGLLVGKLGLPPRIGVGLAAGLALWPAALAVMTRLPRLRRFRGGLPIAEDKGFEGASILMTVLGTCGALGAGAALIVLLEAEGAIARGGGVLLLLATVALIVRSVLHVQAGVAGLRETTVDRAVELASRYANFGVISSFCVAAGLTLMAMMSGFHVVLLVFVACACWMLMAWPLIVRRFYSERQFADLMAGDGANLHRRAPDAGLTGLGWLLLGGAMFGGSMTLPQVIAGAGAGDRFVELFAAMGSIGSRSMWFGVGVTVLQGWAGYELIRMAPGRRVIASAYAVIAGAVAVYSTWPVLEQLTRIRFGGQEMVMFVPMATQLVVPVATLLLVNRRLAPAARARFRGPAAPPAR